MNLRIIIVLSCLLLVAGAAGLVYAESPQHLSIEEIIVTEEALTDPTVTEIDVKTIEKGRNTNIPDVLKNEPDIDIKRRAGVGDAADILAIRGLSANRIMLNINDRPVNAAGVVGGYYIDWATIPIDNIEKIEIIRGGSSAIYGNNALGGVINVVSKRPTDKPTLTIYGNYGGEEIKDAVQNYRMTHTYKIGPVGYSLASSYQKAAPFLWNNDFEGKNVALTLTVDMPLQGELSLGGQYTNAIRGFIRQNRLSADPDNPGFYKQINSDYPLALGETFSPYSGKAFEPGPGATWDKTKYYLDLGYKQPIGDALVEMKIYKNYEDRLEKNYSSSAIVSSYADGKLVLDRKVESDRSYGGKLQVTKPIASHELIAGADYKVLAYGDIIVNYVDTTYNGRSYVGGSPSQAGTAIGYYVQDTWSISQRFTLTAGLRYDVYSNRFINSSVSYNLRDERPTPKLTGTYKMSDNDKATLSAYQAMRTPGLPETYWWFNGGLTKGNPVLKPEISNALEATYRHEFSQGTNLRLSAYYYDIDDYIIFRSGSNANTRGVYNIDNVALSGVSLDTTVAFIKNLTGNASINYQNTKKEGDPYDVEKLTERIDYLPCWKAGAGIDVKLPYNAVVSTSLRYVGERETVYMYTASGNTMKSRLMKLSPFITADADLKIPLQKHAEMSIYAENIFDERYEEQLGYPLPGRILGAAVKIIF